MSGTCTDILQKTVGAYLHFRKTFVFLEPLSISFHLSFMEPCNRLVTLSCLGDSGKPFDKPFDKETQSTPVRQLDP